MEQVRVQMDTGHGHRKTITLNVAPVGTHSIILGLPWIRYHGVQFDWDKGEITHWSPRCEGCCYAAVAALDTKCPDVEECPTPDLIEELAEVYAIELGHTASKKIHPKEQQYADL